MRIANGFQEGCIVTRCVLALQLPVPFLEHGMIQVRPFQLVPASLE